MATVTFDGKLLAVDKATWSGADAGGGVWNATSRLFELRAPERQRLGMSTEGRAWIAFVAQPGYVGKVHDWLVGLAEEAPPAPDRNETIGIVVTSSKMLYRLTGWYSLSKIESLPFAGGAGEELALGAMLAGAGAAMALALAARRANYVGAGIDFVNIESGDPGVLDFDVRVAERKL
jgi:hypothetical protein